jgi:hypothetical protein
VLVAAASMVSASSALADFGLEQFSVAATNQNGSPDVQAGSHPYGLTTTFTFNQPSLAGISQGTLKDARLELPPGFVGDPDATPKCAYVEFISTQCPNDTVVGMALSYFINVSGRPLHVDDSVYNLESSPGVAAEFAFKVDTIVPVFLNASVRTGWDYGITVNVSNVPAAAEVDASKVTIWGVPSEASHNARRGTCLSKDESEGKQGLRGDEVEREGPAVTLGECPVNVPVLPLLTNPTSCAVPRKATLSVDSWEQPGTLVSDSTSLPELSGCKRLNFSPSIDVTPDGTAGSTPTGLNVDLHVPQEATVNPVGLAEADVKDTTVTLPAGMQLSPSAANGLQACSNAEIGFKGVNAISGADEFTSELPTPLEPGVNFCPNASKVANVKIKTPLLEQELEGAVYLAAPQNFAEPLENPFGSLVALYLVAEDPTAGVLVKLAGKVTPNEQTGQLTTTFENTPQLPFSDLKLEFYGTDRAPLATPAPCGTYTTTSSFTPWSAPESGPPATPSSSFNITSGPATVSEPNGTPCPGATLPFSPTLQSGTTNINAGSFSNLTTTLSREDGQQNIQQVTLHYPPGVSGILSGVKLCGETEANAGTCGPESLIGETIVSVGLGNDPFSVTGGKVYITGPYEGAPFGLSIVNPAKAGPFDLQEGRPVVVRAKIEVNSLTAALTVTTNTAAQGYAIPSMIEGIPLQIQHVNVLVNRPGFTFNPTNCEKMAVTGTIDSAEGASSAVSDPFQVTNCQALKFEPKLAVSTSGKTSKADGASLTVKITKPAVQGVQADIAKFRIDLPKQLPSRLTTLQKACTDAQFNANPAGCPAASVVGHMKVLTPLIPVPLEGPMYFVSHGGEAFPDLEIVLQGYGVKIVLTGNTFISKAGVTSSTFNTIPDQPFSFAEAVLPEGKYSALAANGNLCTSKLALPTAFVAQNGAEIHQNTPVTVQGCSTSLSFTSSIKKKTLTLSVYAPAAGKLTASGKGLTTVSKTAKGQEDITITLKQKKAGKLKTKIKLTFQPKHGAKQTKMIKIKFKK